MKEDVSEALEIEKRKTNLIVHGVRDWKDMEGEDREFIEDMLSKELNIDAVRHIEEVTSVGQFVENRIRPIGVKIKMRDGKQEILKRAKNLKDSLTYRRVYIIPDLIRKAQEVDKELRLKVKHFKENGESSARIKSGKVVKNGKHGGVAIL